MDTVTTLATIPAVLALTNVFKAFGIEGRWAFGGGVSVWVCGESNPELPG